MNIYQMYCNHWQQPGFWVARTPWVGTVAKIKRVGKLLGKPPYFGNPKVTATVYHRRTGEVLDDNFEISSAGTFKTWRLIDPPSWSTDKPFDPAAGRVVLNVPFNENKVAKKIGAKWNDMLDAWSIADTDTKALAKAKELGFMEPLPVMAYFVGEYEQREVAKLAGATYDSSKKAWGMPVTNVDGIAGMLSAGYKEIQP